MKQNLIDALEGIRGGADIYNRFLAMQLREVQKTILNTSQFANHKLIAVMARIKCLSLVQLPPRQGMII